MQFPKNCPALMRRCCCGPSDEDILSQSMKEHDLEDIASVGSVSPTTPDTAGTPGADAFAEISSLSSKSLSNEDLDPDQIALDFATRGRRCSTHHEVIADVCFG